jgi:hypothetical protein
VRRHGQPRLRLLVARQRPRPQGPVPRPDPAPARPAPPAGGLRPPGPSFEGVECDLTLTEARQGLQLLVNGNGNLLERLLSGFQLYPGPELHAAAGLARAASRAASARHYRGSSAACAASTSAAEKPRAKTLLYAYRVALTGIHLLRTGEVIADLRELAPRLGYPEALALVQIKVEGAEKGAVSPEIDARHRAAWPALEADLQAALEHSPLPEDRPPTRPPARTGWSTCAAPAARAASMTASPRAFGRVRRRAGQGPARVW